MKPPLPLSSDQLGMDACYKSGNGAGLFFLHTLALGGLSRVWSSPKQHSPLSRIRVVLLSTLVLFMSGCSNHASPQTAASASGSLTATVDQIQRLKSWGLSVGDLPPGTKLVVAEEVPESATAGNPQSAQQPTPSGAVGGYLQQWIQDRTQLQIANEFILRPSASSAKDVLSQPVPADPKYEITNQPDPKLGEVSRMYRFTAVAQTSPRLQGWVVQWVRGRTVLEVRGVDPTGQLQGGPSILAAARAIDGRATKNPIK
jgi:hypothetical protein